MGYGDYLSIKAAGTAPDGETHIPILICHFLNQTHFLWLEFVSLVLDFKFGFTCCFSMQSRASGSGFLLLNFLFTEPSCSRIFMSRITNVHAMLAQRITGRVVRPAEHTAQRESRKRIAHGPLSLVFLTLIRCRFLGSTPKRRWERGTSQLFFAMLTGANWGIIFHWRRFTWIYLIQERTAVLNCM